MEEQALLLDSHQAPSLHQLGPIHQVRGRQAIQEVQVRAVVPLHQVRGPQAILPTRWRHQILLGLGSLQKTHERQLQQETQE